MVESDSTVSPSVTPARVRYIKLGGGGSWEQECLAKDIIRIGFGTARADRFVLCQSRKWKELTDSFGAEGKDKGTATRFTKELRLFFEDEGTTLERRDRCVDLVDVTGDMGSIGKPIETLAARDRIAYRWKLGGPRLVVEPPKLG